MKLQYLHAFLVEFDALDKGARKQIRKKLDELSRQEFDQVGHLPLKGSQFKDLYKLRIGDWRLIYKIENGACVFIALGHLSEVYQ